MFCETSSSSSEKIHEIQNDQQIRNLTFKSSKWVGLGILKTKKIKIQNKNPKKQPHETMMKLDASRNREQDQQNKASHTL
jgi:hypothetical protein